MQQCVQMHYDQQLMSHVYTGRTGGHKDDLLCTCERSLLQIPCVVSLIKFERLDIQTGNVMHVD